MKNDSICGNCGRAIQKDFVYCPWCGENQLSQRARENTKISEEQAVERRREIREQQFQAIEKKLEMLEQELNVLVLCAEMAR